MLIFEYLPDNGRVSDSGDDLLDLLADDAEEQRGSPLGRLLGSCQGRFVVLERLVVVTLYCSGSRVNALAGARVDG